MNYYERHLGDYARDAGHLSMLEHGAYSLLLDRYYTTEQSIPADQAHRVCRARTREEREAVDAVLAEFFTLFDGRWISARAEREIEKYKEAEPEREAKRANAKERQRRTRERRRELFEELRTFGVVPEYDTGTTELQMLLSRVKSQRVTPLVTPPVTRDATATHTPGTNTHTPEEKEREAPAALERKRTPPPLKPESVTDQVWADWLSLRKAKKAPVTQTVVDNAVREAAKAGMSLNDFLTVWCSRGSQGLEASWLKPSEKSSASTGKHSGFELKDYTSGVNADGSLA